MKKQLRFLVVACLVVSIGGGSLLSNNSDSPSTTITETSCVSTTQSDITYDHIEVTVPEDVTVYIPLLTDTAYIALNNNTPYFNLQDYDLSQSFEIYGELDTFGRCTICIANVGYDLMPTGSRGSISSVYPTGWKYNGKSNNHKYSTDIVSGSYIYNRSHLIGWQLTGENARKENLVTGTRFFNVTGMLPFENMVADYIKENKTQHVLYRIIPVFIDEELVCRGIIMEAFSVEDGGESILFCVFVYNVQPGIIINYLTGENSLE